MKHLILFVGLMVIACHPTVAASLATDSAADPAYDSGWSNGDNGGSGFGPWQLSASGTGGHFTASSSGNANGSSGNVDTGGRSWGMWSATGTTEAVRSFTGILTTDQTFHIAFDNGWINSGRSAGLGLRNTSSQNLWEFFFNGGAANFTILHHGGAVSTDIPFTGDGLFLEFTLTGPTSYFLRVNAQVAGGTQQTFYVYEGHLIAQANQGIQQFRAWNFNTGPGSDFDVYLNAIAVTPSTLQPLPGDPWVDSWFLDPVGRYARIFESTADQNNNASKTTWTRGSTTQSTPAYSGVQAVYSSSNFIYSRSSGLGFHVMGPWYLNAGKTMNFPNFPLNKKVLWRTPKKSTLPITRISTGLGSIGIFMDGVAMFDSRDGFIWNGSAEVGMGVGYWNRDAYVNESVTFDPAYAHQEQSGTYHYHANPIALRHLMRDHVTFNSTNRTYAESTSPVTEHSPILGWVRDGHPIYGPYGFANPTNPAAGVRRMISGYKLRNGQNNTDNLTTAGRTNIPVWAQRAYGVGPNQSGPAVSGTYPLGRYMEDNAYLGDLGYVKGVHFDLDEFNGRHCITPEFPNGTYAYFVSIASNGAPVFPYNIGRQYHSQTNGGNVVAITEPVTTNFLGGAYGQETLRNVSAFDDTVVMVWQSVEGAGYVIEASSNLNNWAIISTNLFAATNANLTSNTRTNGMVADQHFQRVRRSSLATFDPTF